MRRRNKRIATGLAVLLTTCACVYFAISWYFSSLILLPGRDPSKLTEILTIEQRPGYFEAYTIERFALHAAQDDQTTVPGWYLRRDGQAACVLVLLHGWQKTRVSVQRVSRAFEAYRCDLVLFDQRAHGFHQADYATGGIFEAQDLLLVHRWLLDEHNWRADQIAWFGVSWGANTAIHAAAATSKLAFLVLDSPFMGWHEAVFERGVRRYGAWVTAFEPGINLCMAWRSGVTLSQSSAIDRMQAITSPVLLIHSATDQATSSDHSVALARQLPASQLVFHHTRWGSKHAGDFDNAPDTYTQLVETFVRHHAGDFGKARSR